MVPGLASRAGMPLERANSAFGAVGHRLPRRTLFAIGILAGGIEYAALLASLPLAAVIAAFALAGFFFGPIDPIYSTVLQEHTCRGNRLDDQHLFSIRTFLMPRSSHPEACILA